MKSQSCYYNQSVIWKPYLKEELDKLNYDQLIQYRHDFISKSNWYHATKNKIDLNQYVKELMNYTDLRFSTLKENFEKWKTNTDKASKLVVKVGLDALITIEKNKLTEELPNHKYITGLTLEEYS